MVDDVAISNGLDWSLDGRTMYYVDTPTRRIDRFDFDPATGAISDRRPFVTIDPPSDGSPDGLTVDAEGGIWLALWDGWVGSVATGPTAPSIARSGCPSRR